MGMERDFQQHIKRSFDIWEQRSYQQWELDVNFMDTMDSTGKPSNGLAIKMHRKISWPVRIKSSDVLK